MGEDSKIEWTHHTFNPWWGCAKVSEGCSNCYASALDRWFFPDEEHWGANASRRFFGDKHWNDPIRWNRKARREGTRHRVFCGSMCDWAEDRTDVIPHRRRLFDLIAETPHLDWLLLTKRPENLCRLLPWYSSRVSPWSNVWLGVTAENQERADKRIPILCAFPAVCRFVSYEPAIGPVDFRPYLPQIDWLIAGAESGLDARPMELDWIRSVRDDCVNADTAFFFKQKIQDGLKVSIPEIDGFRWIQIPEVIQ